MFVLFVFVVLLDLGDSALIPLTKREGSVRSCMHRIIEVYADDSTTVLSLYTNETKGNFLPQPMKIPMININADGKVFNFNYQTRKELVIIDLANVNFNNMKKFGLWSDENLLKRKFVFTWPLDAYTQVQNAFSYLWHSEILDATVLVYDYSFRSNFTEVFVSNQLHPSNRCGTLVKNMSKFTCDMINKNWKQTFFRNYNKCRLTYRYELTEEVNNEINYITKFALSEIVSTLNITFFKKLKSAGVTKNDSYLLLRTNMRSCIYKKSGILDYKKIIYNRMEKDYATYYEEMRDEKIVLVLLDLGDSALIPLTKREGSVRSCMHRIIEVYADDSTTVLSLYTNETKGNFLPQPMKIPMININADGKVFNFNYQTRKELVIIDLVNVNFNNMEKFGLWSNENLLKRKFVFTWPLDAYTQVQNAFSYLWHFEIPDATVLVYDYSFRSNFTEVFVSNQLHPSNRCGTLVKNMSKFTCDMINKNWKQTFFRNYNKCRLTYRYELTEEVNNEINYITKFALSEIVSTLNITFFKKLNSAGVTKNDSYLLLRTNMRSCIYKSMFCGVTFTKEVIVWTIPSPKKMDSLEVFKLIFKWNSWILIFLSFIVTSVMWWAISTCRSLTSSSSAFFNVYSLTLTGAIPTVPKCFSLRCLFLTYVIYAIHIQTGFTSNLVTLLTVPQYSVIKTIEELVDTNLPILVPHSSANLIFNMSHEGNQIFEKMKKNMMFVPHEEWCNSMENLQLLENSSIMSSMDNVHVLVNKIKKKVNFLIDLDGTLLQNELHTFSTRQGSCIIQDVNKVLNILIESGILDYKKIIYNRMEKDYATYYEEMRDEKIVLGMKHVYPIFLFWGVGMLVATVAFILEHVTYNVKNN
ncbi:hypothetical protein FQA39_LY05593 [Lamprigera yunnana]|nr:hypothetical protein FQA39_LY05593 [Lamprigera yunnana]